MNIEIFLEPIANADKLVKHILHEEFGISMKNAERLFEKVCKSHFDKLNDNIFLLAETNYVDKVFRDSYYHYYSSKFKKYKRDCTRISLFEGAIRDSDFFDNTERNNLQEKYRGFIVLRPTEPYIIGRSLVSPKALKNNNFACCTTRISSTVNGIKLFVDGFPHSSQDTETISCAETTLWALMEYFSNKYSEYRPLLPSRIISTLNKVTFERQVPSKGLNISQMSYALKEFGFGIRIYSRDQYNTEFESLLSCYVESGIPLIIALENRPVGSIGHAILAIGHEVVNEAQIDAITPYLITNNELKIIADRKNIVFYDYDSVKKGFIYIDDNHPTYQLASIDRPALHYVPNWHNCIITYFIVPLYPKIYLEAFEARSFIMRFLTIGPEPLNDNSEVLLRIYLASSRSFKDKLTGNDTFNEDLKHLIIETAMPKFIWVSELSTIDLIKTKKANGIIIIDATEANIFFNKPLIIAAYQNKLITFDEKTGELEFDVLPLPEFTIYENNLNSF